MKLHELDPLQDARWPELLAKHPDASVFHSTAWLAALRDTYGYRCKVFTASGPGEELTNAAVFCTVKSWLTGWRLVSLPFADHCQPLLSAPGDLATLMTGISERFGAARWKYIEMRPLQIADAPDGFNATASYCFHSLNLDLEANELYRRFHKSCIQRKIQKAEKENLTLEQGRSKSLIEKMYALLLLTRRRHQLPPQPMSWFQSLARHFGEDLTIWIVSKESRPVAGMLTLAGRTSVVYKYGCSDAERHNLGGMPFLFWHAIQYAKLRGAKSFDFGRSDLDNPGLMTFKDHWGSQRSELVYYRRAKATQEQTGNSFGARLARKTLASLPDYCLTATGRLIYRHIG